MRASQPPLAQRARTWNATHPIVVTKILIAVNLAVFLIGAATVTNAGDYFAGSFPRLPDFLARYVLFGPSVARGEWWRLVSSGFLHFGLLHIGFNMFVLYQLGRLMEPILGRARFAAVYMASLLAGSALVLVLSPNVPSAGASGAIFGVLGCAIVVLRARGVNIWQTGLGTMLIINLVLTFSISNISIGGHIGGLIGGGLCGLGFAQPAGKRSAKLAAYLPVAVAVVSVVVAEVVVRR